MTPDNERRPAGDRTANAQAGNLDSSVPAWADTTRQLDQLILETLDTNPAWWTDRIAPRLVEVDTGCLEWTGHRNSGGYGQIRIPAPHGRLALVHRAALIRSLGRPIALGMQAGHQCHDEAYAAGLCAATTSAPCAHRRCANPLHLVEQDPRTNTLSSGSITALNAAKIRCQRGHELAGDNLRIDARGNRDCRACKAEWNAAISAAHKALGLTHRHYLSIFGSSRTVADDILTRLAFGVRPAVILGALGGDPA